MAETEKKDIKTKKEKKGKPRKEKKAKAVKGVAAASTAEPNEKKNNSLIRKAALPFICIFLFGVVVFSIYMLIDRNSAKTEASENGETAETAETGEVEKKPEKYKAAFVPGEVKAIQNIDDKSAEPYVEVTVHSAKVLSPAEKVNYGLANESGRLAVVEMDVHLIDESGGWDLYNRRFADTKGNWLDEIKSISSEDFAVSPLGNKESMFIRLTGDQGTAEEKISLSVYTASWNRKKKADGICDIIIEPPQQSGAREPVIRNADTKYGNWTGNTYTSSKLDMRVTLPDEWDLQDYAAGVDSGTKAIEGLAVRSDRKATLQISVESEATDASEMDRVSYVTGLLSDAFADFTISAPYYRTIAGKEYLGFRYSRMEEEYQVYFHKTDDSIIEIALHFPSDETAQAKAILDQMKALSPA
ncbi:MAG: hypothetical protein FWH49_04130 [Clostridiales bacterium]|nr:hypothetical protein [Clostridiales bacterium]